MGTKVCFLLFCFFAFLLFIGTNFFLPSGEVSAMTMVSDRINISWPGASTSHAITFLTTEPIPASGKIVIEPQTGQFFIPAGFDHEDVDLATAMAISGPYTDRDLTALPSATEDGVAALASSTSGLITITLSSNFGIPAGVYVRVELGANADHGALVDSEIINPSTIGSYSIIVRSLDASGALLTRAKAMIAVIDPVTMNNDYIKTRTKGAPVGFLAYGTTQTVISLVSNYNATCRYSQTASTSYDDMTGEFAYTGGPSAFHSVTVGGLSQNSSNDYYVRCMDETGAKDDATLCIYEASGDATTTIATSCVDYLISFMVTTIEDAVGDESGTPGPGGGGVGGGGGGGIGREDGRGTGNLLPYPPLPENPGVAFSGWAYPGADVVILKDGSDEGAIKAGSDAVFGAFLPDITQGVYTFGLWAEDNKGVRSETYSTTFWVDEGTQTVLSDIFLPPTLSASADSIEIGDLLELSGQSVPGSTVEVWLYPGQGSDISEADALKAEAVVDTYGSWALSLRTGSLPSSGDYSVSARASISEEAKSDWGRPVSVKVGGEPAEEEPGTCEGADLNQDGKVNITDFSILLYHWGSDNDCADQNNSGNVDLIDFSIMMYYWTG